MNQVVLNVFIEDLSFAALSNFFKHHHHSSHYILLDEHTLRHCYPIILKYLPPHQIIQMQAGEEHKSLKTCETIWQKLTESNADRNSLLINLGGGVIGDLGGFAAGCYKRGIQFINIPTTLLAMVDANVGAKTGVDFMGFKNQIGLFNEPEGVFVYTGFLKTLPERELKSGFAEVMKHYLIADGDGFEEISKQTRGSRHQTAEKIGHELEFSKNNWDRVVEKNIRIKSGIVSQDPQEQNIRKALNFGHTIGHAVESHFLNNECQKLLHGEAVAVGMIAEGFISMKQKLLSASELDAIRTTILNYYDLPEISPTEFKAIGELMKQDKKNSGEQIQFTLLKGIGNYSINQSVKEDTIKESLDYYNRVLHEYSEGKSSH
ncbi:MAG: 3-dehydroquinate synthase [Bacteroidetes bacterium]|nr:3-dehydroquinate synthase [Bacteroidota bacterium]